MILESYHHLIAPLQVILSEVCVSVSTRRPKWITSGQVFLERPWPRPHLALNLWTFSSQSSLSILFTPKGGIGLRSSKGNTASLVDQTGTTVSENGVYAADTKQSHDTRVFVGLLEHFKSRPRYIKTLVLLMLTGSPLPYMLIVQLPLNFF